MKTLPLFVSILLALPAAAWQTEVNTGNPGPYLKIKPISLDDMAERYLSGSLDQQAA